MSDRRDPARLDPDTYPGPGLDLPVLYADLDTNGHLNNVAMGRFFEHARASVLSDAKFWHPVHQSGARTVIGRVAIDYLAEVHFGQFLNVRTRLLSIGTSSATLQQAAWWEGTCAGLAEVVFVQTRDGVPAPWSEEARAVLELLRP